MSLRQIHELNKIVKKQHRSVIRELKILEMKKKLYSILQDVSNSIVETYEDIINRFTYDNKSLVLIKRK